MVAAAAVGTDARGDTADRTFGARTGVLVVAFDADVDVDVEVEFEVEVEVEVEVVGVSGIAATSRPSSSGISSSRSSSISSSWYCCLWGVIGAGSVASATESRSFDLDDARSLCFEGVVSRLLDADGVESE